MRYASTRVLLVGKSESAVSHLRAQLESRGCQCWFARSTRDGASLHDKHRFHLILGASPSCQMSSLGDEFDNRCYTAFYCHPVDIGCWWLPVMYRGRKCVGSPGVRSNEFMRVVERVLQEIRLEITVGKSDLRGVRSYRAA
jgi:hypothetical protein